MNAELQNITDQLATCFDPNEIAFALATSYNGLSRKPGTNEFNYRVFKKIATQFARVNGHFPVSMENRPRFVYANSNEPTKGNS